MRRFFIKAGPDGEVETIHRNNGKAPEGYEHEIFVEELMRAIMRSPEKFFATGDLKPVVQIIPDKSRLIADGEDIVIFEFRGIPEDRETVQVRVGARVVTLDRDDSIVVSTDTTGELGVSLLEPALFADPVDILAVAS